jgi:CheY-like chemotaxis protein
VRLSEPSASLPVEASAPDSITRAAVLNTCRDRGRILLVEDNPTNTEVALGILTKMGLLVDAVTSGADALCALATVAYDLVLMDVQMPEMDGLEATRRIRQPGSAVLNPAIPLVAMTAHAMQGDRERCLAAGMNDYLQKPVSPQALASALDRWLPTADLPGQESVVAVAPAPEAVIPVVIFDQAELMERLLDDAELADRVIDSFLKDMPQQIDILRHALEQGDAVGIERQAHSIKGAAANVGGHALRAVALKIEMAGKNRELGAVNSSFEELQMRFSELREVLDSALPNA